MRIWAAARDEIRTQAVHEGRLQEYARAKGVFEQLSASEQEQTARAEDLARTLKETEGLQAELAAALENARASERAKADVVVARDRLEAVRAVQARDLESARQRIAQLELDIRSQAESGVAERTRLLEEHRESRRVVILDSMRKRFALRSLAGAFGAWRSAWRAAGDAMGQEAAEELRRQQEALMLGKQSAAEAATEAAHARAAAAEARIAELQAALARAEGALKDKDEEIDVLKARADAAATDAVARGQSELEAKVELLGKQMVRRMLARDLALGWTAWVERWEAKVHAMRTIRQIAHRFLNRDLSNAFFFWVGDYEEQKREEEEAMKEGNVRALLLQLQDYEDEIRRLRKEMRASGASKKGSRASQKALMERIAARKAEEEAAAAAAQ